MNGISIKNVSDKYIDILLNKKKYPILDKIKKEQLEFVLDEIVEIGYNQYMKNLTRVDLQSIQVTNNQINTTNAITESKYSSLKGSQGENIVIDILIDKFSNCTIENTTKIPHSGDIQMTFPDGNKIIVEIKNYNKTIDQEQIDKLKFDMIFNNIKGALFVSLNSGIVGKKKFELEFFKNNMNDCFIIYLPYSMHKFIPEKKNIIMHNSIDDSISNLSIKLEFGICIIQNIITKSNSDSISMTNKLFSELELDYMVIQFNSLYTEFKNIKNSIRKLDEGIKKNLESHKLVIGEYENFILNKINNLIGNKLFKNNFFDLKKNIKLEKNNFGNWDILIDEKLYGMIININECYDVLVNYQNNLINKQFVNFVECINFVNQL